MDADGMSAILSVRSKQPGNQPRSVWSAAEQDAFEAVVQTLLDLSHEGTIVGLDVIGKNKRLVELHLEGEVIWRIDTQSTLLRNIYGRNPVTGREHGLCPELEAVHVPTGRPFFLEVKNQGEQGNAHERLAKLFTPKLSRKMKEYLGIEYHPYLIVLCGALATHPRYQREISNWLDEDQYACLTDSARSEKNWDCLQLPISSMIYSMGFEYPSFNSAY